MSTLRLFSSAISIHPAAAWYLADLGEFRGKQELYTRQSPQRLKALREHALIESAVASNRIEGVAVDAARVREVLGAPKPLFRDRDEEEVRGYRDALEWIFCDATEIAVSEESIRRLHAMARGQIWDAGLYKEKDGDIIERYADGSERVRFRPVAAVRTGEAMAALVSDWRRCLDEAWVHPLIALAAFNLDFLCIHPFRDGNGRVSRLLLLLSLYHMGFTAGRFVSLERIVEQNKERYYETLRLASQGWHQGRHDPWPYVNYLLYTLKELYREFERRYEDTTLPKGEKTDAVRQAVLGFAEAFHINEICKRCPEVSLDLVRKVLKTMREANEVECLGRGKHALWRRIG